MPAADYATEHGQGHHTSRGYLWVCDLCHLVTFLDMAGDVDGFDPRRWLDSIDSTHWCGHRARKEY